MDGPAAASPSNSTIARIRNLLCGWRQRFGLDLRSLALFRILLGLLLLVDLATRLTDLRVFYSDAGVLPRVDLLGRVATSSTPWLVSLHMLSGLWGVQLLLFAIAAFCAFCLMIGHRTRLFTFLSWVLLVSLHSRNLTILNAGDLLFRVLLFWSLFLPLGARCSVDAAMREPSDEGPGQRNDRTWSVPAFCFMAQVTILYWATALLKNHPVWTGDRTAVWYALHLDYMALPLAVLMRELPAAWLELMTGTTLLVEFLVPALIWIPFLVGPLRLAACVVMIGMHLAFAATLQIGLFSYICSAMWLALLPPRVWDRLFARFRRDKERLGMTIHYDADCGFCRRMVLLLRSFFLLPETRVAEAQDDAEIDRDMRARNSWVVTDGEGKRRFKFEAFAWVLSRSPWAWPAGKILGMAAFRGPGTWLYEETANRRELMGRLTGWMRPRRERQARRPLVWLRNGFLLATLAYVRALERPHLPQQGGLRRRLGRRQALGGVGRVDLQQGRRGGEPGRPPLVRPSPARRPVLADVRAVPAPHHRLVRGRRHPEGRIPGRSLPPRRPRGGVARGVLGSPGPPCRELPRPALAQVHDVAAQEGEEGLPAPAV